MNGQVQPSFERQAADDIQGQTFPGVMGREQAEFYRPRRGDTAIVRDVIDAGSGAIIVMLVTEGALKRVATALLVEKEDSA